MAGGPQINGEFVDLARRKPRGQHTRGAVARPDDAISQVLGVAIRAHIEERSGRIVSSGAINTTLGRLAERRLVTGRVGAPVPGRAGRPRKYYALTPAGARDLQESYTAIRAMAGGLLRRLDALAEEGS